MNSRTSNEERSRNTNLPPSPAENTCLQNYIDKCDNFHLQYVWVILYIRFVSTYSNSCLTDSDKKKPSCSGTHKSPLKEIITITGCLTVTLQVTVVTVNVGHAVNKIEKPIIRLKVAFLS